MIFSFVHFHWNICSYRPYFPIRLESLVSLVMEAMHPLMWLTGWLLFVLSRLMCWPATVWRKYYGLGVSCNIHDGDVVSEHEHTLPCIFSSDSYCLLFLLMVLTLATSVMYFVHCAHCHESVSCVNRRHILSVAYTAVIKVSGAYTVVIKVSGAYTAVVKM